MTQFGVDKNGAECKDIRPHLKEIDRLFDVVFNYDTERYWVYFNGGLFQSVPFADMDAEIIENIRKAHWTNVNGDPVAEADAHNEKLDRDKEGKRADMVRELAKDLQKAIQKEF